MFEYCLHQGNEKRAEICFSKKCILDSSAYTQSIHNTEWSFTKTQHG